MAKWENRLLSFLFAGASDRWLTILRIGLGAEILAYSWSLRRDWINLFAANAEGLIRRDLTEALLASEGTFVPRLGWFVFLGEGTGLSESQLLSLLWTLLFAAGCCLLIGLFSRPAAVTAWFLHLSATKSNSLLAYGVDNFMTIGLFYLMLSPLPGGLSIDSRIWKVRNRPELLGFFRRLLQLHLCFIYFFGGLAKCLGAGWWNGLSIWRALTRPPFNVLSIDVVLHWRAILPLAGIVVCLLELTYPLLIWPLRTRFACLICIVALHIGIGLTMGMYLFSFTLIVLNLAAFGPGSLSFRRPLATSATFTRERAVSYT